MCQRLRLWRQRETAPNHNNNSRADVQNRGHEVREGTTQSEGPQAGVAAQVETMNARQMNPHWPGTRVGSREETRPRHPDPCPTYYLPPRLPLPVPLRAWLSAMLGGALPIGAAPPVEHATDLMRLLSGSGLPVAQRTPSPNVKHCAVNWLNGAMSSERSTAGAIWMIVAESRGLGNKMVPATSQMHKEVPARWP